MYTLRRTTLPRCYQRCQLAPSSRTRESCRKRNEKIISQIAKYATQHGNAAAIHWFTCEIYRTIDRKEQRSCVLCLQGQPLKQQS